MCWALVLIGACGCGATAKADAPQEQASPSPPVVVGYLPDYRIAGVDAETYDLGPVTDLIYFGLTVPAEGTLPIDAVPAEHLARLARLKERFGCRVLLCLGGWERSRDFAQVAADPDRRAALIASLVVLCQSHGFDGVDYDWEHPSGEVQRADYARLIEQTAAGFAEHRLLVTVAQAGWQDLGPSAYAAADRIHLMCYDHAYPHATLEHARDEVARLVGWGCPPGKIALGIPFYGRNAERAARSYAQLVEGQTPAPETDELAGYAFNGPDTVTAKMQLALEHGLAGVMVWELALDAPGDASLLKVIAQALAEQDEPSE
ncbi:MAG: glycoside hydrolase family 18 protein [Phycisphaerales bacterium JB063]